MKPSHLHLITHLRPAGRLRRSFPLRWIIYCIWARAHLQSAAKFENGVFKLKATCSSLSCWPPAVDIRLQRREKIFPRQNDFNWLPEEMIRSPCVRSGVQSNATIPQKWNMHNWYSWRWHDVTHRAYTWNVLWSEIGIVCFVTSGSWMFSKPQE